MRRPVFVAISIATSLVAGGCAERSSASVGATRVPVVYGEDDRKEPHESLLPVHGEIARSQVAVRIVDWAVDFEDPDAPRVTYSRTLGVSENLCEGERFFDQVAPGSCSATLIDDQHLLTAAHCVSDPDECDGSHYWVFGFYLLPDGTPAPLTADSVYTCTGMSVLSAFGDFAIVELDRPVTGRVPVPTRLMANGLAAGTPVTLIGFPNGIPAKVDSGGEVTLSEPGEFFLGTVDAFANSSGSGVFDETGRLVGFLQRGATDYVRRGDCYEVNVVESPLPGEGEQVAYLNPVLQAYCAEVSSARLCGCDGPCVELERDAGQNDAGLAEAGSLDGGSEPGPRDAGAGSDASDSAMSPEDSGPEAIDSGCAVSNHNRAPYLGLLFALITLAARRRGPKFS